jgi:hypothetical protein
MTRLLAFAIGVLAAPAKRMTCRLFGHRWIPYKGDFMDPYCVRCEKHPTFAQILRDALKR